VPVFQEFAGTDGMELELEADPGEAGGGGAENLESGGDDLGADTVAREHGDVERGHAGPGSMPAAGRARP
jgi:hypothetical protein